MADPDAELSLSYRPGKGKGTLSATLPNGDGFTDKVDIADAGERARFVKALCKGRKGIDRKAVAAELERLAGEVAKAGEGGEGRRSQADVLLALAVGLDLFHAPGNGGDGEVFASFTANGHRETWAIKSSGFRSWLGRLYHTETGRAAAAQALQDTLGVLAGKAQYDGPERPLAIRVAEHGGAIYLDLADPDWRAVEIDAAGWRVVADPPVRFIRRRGMLALPEPVPGGTVDELRPLVNLPDDDGWILYVAWLLAALRPGRPFPVLAVNGEQGSAKSTLCRFARALIDPNAAPLRRPPRDERDLMIAANNGWMVGYDNLSGVRPELSDALCSLSTGGGYATRELYTDDEEKLFDAMRPILLNGIEDVAVRPDLLDRAICLTLPTIPDADRRDESVLWEDFSRVRPRVLGALLDAVSAALRNLPTTRLACKPRMADFALWVSAAETALPWEPGAFLRAYAGNRGAANELTLEASIVAGPLAALLSADGGCWEGTARELLDALEAAHVDDKTRKRKEWPTGPRKLSGELRRLAPNLRRAGMAVTFDRDSSKQHRRIIRLENRSKTPSEPSEPSDAPEIARENVGRSAAGNGPDRPIPSDTVRSDHGNSATSDGSDGSDGLLRPDSDWEEVEWTA